MKTKSMNHLGSDNRPTADWDRAERSLIRRAMSNSDEFALAFDYIDSRGRQTRRTVSPIRFCGPDRMLALCLSREEPRQFNLSRCTNWELLSAASLLMPVPIGAPLAVNAVG